MGRGQRMIAPRGWATDSDDQGFRSLQARVSQRDLLFKFSLPMASVLFDPSPFQLFSIQRANLRSFQVLTPRAALQVFPAAAAAFSRAARHPFHSGARCWPSTFPRFSKALFSACCRSVSCDVFFGFFCRLWKGAPEK